MSSRLELLLGNGGSVHPTAVWAKLTFEAVGDVSIPSFPLRGGRSPCYSTGTHTWPMLLCYAQTESRDLSGLCVHHTAGRATVRRRQRGRDSPRQTERWASRLLILAMTAPRAHGHVAPASVAAAAFVAYGRDVAVSENRNAAAVVGRHRLGSAWHEQKESKRSGCLTDLSASFSSSLSVTLRGACAGTSTTDRSGSLVKRVA
eukprot:scaffold3127_cov202-Prasinococcus_capsulatus_cf.AAC.11